MSLSFPNITIGTAGHIDHGKTSLVRFLTGCDTDCLREEKERQMTIELGHTSCTIGDYQVGIVDVPGHESFIKTMVAGANGMDGVIFVVAADDGVMPQTKEHLDILTLLGIKYGIIAVTKIDRVASKDLPEIIEKIKFFLKGTFLETSPIFPVNNLTGDGFFDFQEGLLNLIKQIPLRKVDGIFRLPIEKIFSIPGSGTVVTGIPISGQIKINEDLILYPSKQEGHIRKIQVYGHNVQEALSGQCAAINISNLQKTDITRGNILAPPGLITSDWFIAEISLLTNTDLKITNSQQVNLHVGTSMTQATIYLLNSSTVLKDGDRAFVQIHTKNPLTIIPKDRFIIRSLSPNKTIGGGNFLKICSHRLRRYEIDINQLDYCLKIINDPKSWTLYNLETNPPYLMTNKTLSMFTNLPLEQTTEIIAELKQEKKVRGNLYGSFLATSIIDNYRNKILEVIKQFHQENKESLGTSISYIRNYLQIDRFILNAVLDCMLNDRDLKKTSGLISLFEHNPEVEDQEQHLLNTIEKLYKENKFSPPSENEIFEKLNIPLSKIQKCIVLLKQQQKLVYIGEKIHFHRDSIDIAKNLIRKHIQENGCLFSVDAKNILETTRKFAIPLLDYLDKVNFFIREGNTRYLKEKISK